MFFSQTATDRFGDINLKFILTETDGHLFTITLNRPEKRNAFTPTMVKELVYALAYAQIADDIWCIRIQANGPVFCAGMDLNAFSDPSVDTPNEALPEPESPVNLGDCFRMLDKPVIAKVEGAVLAGGFLIVGGCTFVAATTEVFFGLPEVKRGIFPMQVLSGLLKIMHERQAMRLCILGENITAQRAYDLGIVSHLSDREHISETCDQLIKSILANSPFAIRKGMETARELHAVPEDQQFGYLIDKLDQLGQSEDAKEGIAAFKQKRQPEWKNK